MKKLRVGILFRWRSGEHEVSLLCRRRPDLRLRVASTTDCQNQKDNEQEI
ncbi:MAG TPA: hypothetical protein VMU26_27255 [Candidatus Polarisedimenticolia bacterium]|nr:hypothetical protein [Candidatus Polarisedimenticolia bacterium]